MAINLVNDAVPPVVVAAAHIMVESQPTMAPYADYIDYGGAILGYAGAYLNWGGDFVKNLGIAFAPSAIEKVYRMITTPTTTTARPVAFAPASHPSVGQRVASTRQEFANIRLG